MTHIEIRYGGDDIEPHLGLPEGEYGFICPYCGKLNNLDHEDYCKHVRLVYEECNCMPTFFDKAWKEKAWRILCWRKLS